MADRGRKILSRTLQAIIDGKRQPIALSIQWPRQIADQELVCGYSFPSLDSANGKIYGSDGFQALCLCLRYLKRRLHDINKAGVAEIWWLERGDNGGL